MPAILSTRPPSRFSNALLYLAWIFTTFATITQILVLIAGTWITDGGSRNQVALSSLSIVSFNGIVPDSENPDKYLVKMHYFLNAFGWEYPSATEKSHTAGLVYSQGGRDLYLPRDFIKIGEQLDLDPSSWDCFSPNWGTCTNSFYQIFYRGFPFDYSILLSLIIYCYALFIIFYVLINELMIAYRPHWMRCRCWILKKWCPCPKGTMEEIESLPAVFWDRYRMWLYPLVGAGTALAAINLMLRGMLLISYLGFRDNRAGGGMDAQLGSGFLTIAWAGVGAAQLAWLCTLIRYLISKRATWIEQQGAAAKGVEVEGRDVGLVDSEAGERGLGGQGQYTDEPEPSVPKNPAQGQ